MGQGRRLARPIEDFWLIIIKLPPSEWKRGLPGKNGKRSWIIQFE